jgi:hypothetical protein
MKKLVQLFCITIILAWAGTASAQSIRYYIFKLGGGISTPIEKEGIYDRDNGYNLNMGTGYLFHRNIGARLDMDYDLFRDPTGKGPTTADNPQFYMLSFKLGITAGYFKKKTKVKPYAVAGLGFHYLTDLRTDLVIIQNSETDFSVFAGAGIFFTFSGEGGLYLESEYQSFISGNRLKANIPVRAGLVYCPGR